MINVVNQRRWRDVYPEEDCAKYVANGEIGIVVGQFKGPQAKYRSAPWKLEVEFTAQPRFTYGYTERDFVEEGEAPIEPAHAITVHKAQGSEFGTVVLVLPYRDNEVSPYPETGGRNGVLVATSDNPETGFDTLIIGKIVEQLGLG